MKIPAIVGAMLLLLVAPGAMVAAQDDGPSVSANVAFTSDYTFRGISQAKEDPAIQGGFDFESDGFYIGTWASNVDFDSAAHAEFDVYLGYTKEYDSGFSWDVGLLQYFYPSESVLDTLEVYFGVGFSGFGLKAYYTDEYFGVDTDAIYLDATYELSLPNEFGLGFHLAQSSFDSKSGLEDYIDYSVSLSRSAAGLDFTLALVGTDIDNCGVCDDRVVLTIGKSF